MVAAHTDSPCLKVKPVSKRRPKDNFLQVAVETYGGGLWNTWFDRDLGLAGRITLLDEKTGGLKERLVNICQPVLRIPTLAIHLDRSVKDGFSFNTELQLNPVLATRSTDNQQASAGSEEDEKASHHRALLSLLQPDSKSGVASDTIISSDLCLYDIQKAALGGAYQEFVLSARLDNLMLSFCTAEAFAQATANLEEEEHIRMAIWFDNEEVGSESAHGAMSTLVSSAVDRIAQALGHQATMHEMLAKSMLVSADMAHAVHPNYADKHDECHRPEMHAGVVIKYNSNQRYATSSRSAAIIKAIAHAQSIPIQEFMVRNDSPCGSTIGPIVSAKLGIMTIDVGLPQLSMHSIREMAGTRDVDLGIRLLKVLFKISYILIYSYLGLLRDKITRNHHLYRIRYRKAQLVLKRLHWPIILRRMA